MRIIAKSSKLTYTFFTLHYIRHVYVHIDAHPYASSHEGHGYQAPALTHRHTPPKGVNSNEV